MRNSAVLTVFILCVGVLSSCKRYAEQHNAETATDSFSVYYFNYDLQNASRFVSDKWIERLKFLASNIDSTDIDKINSSEKAEIEIIETSLEDNMTEAASTIEVRNWLKKGFLRDSLRKVETALFELSLTKENKEWKVVNVVER